MAEITTVVRTVPSSTGSNGIGSGLIFIPSDLLVGEDMIRIDFTAILIDLLAVDTRGACTRLQVKTDASKVGVFVGTPGTFDVLPSMDGGFQMLKWMPSVIG